MSEVVSLPTAAIPRGAVVRHRDGGPNMLALGSNGALTVTVFADEPAGNTMLGQFRTAELVVVLAPTGDVQRVANKAVKFGRR